jgi:hypothetical protein
LTRAWARALVSLLIALPAHAGTLHLRWDRCLGDGGGVNRSFACDTNEGRERLVGSFVLADSMRQVSGVEVMLDVVITGTALPAWWQLKNAGSCRQAALVWSTDAPADAEHCSDWAFGQAVGGLAAYKAGVFGPGSARIVGVSAVPYPNLSDLNPGTEYFAFALVLTHAKSAGKGACEGCRLGACIGLRSIKLTTPVAANDRTLVPAADDAGDRGDRRATWQGGAGVVIPPGREKLECSFSYRVGASPRDRLLALY